MNLFDKVLKHDETLFKNEVVLDYDYLPHILKYREDQQQQIANIIKPLFQSRMGSNLIITGKPGIGKTAACKHVLRDMEQHSNSIKGIIVNCWKHDTAYKAIVEICNQLDYKWVQNKKTNELMKEIASILNKKSAVIILDEVDKLKEEQLIYYLLEDLFKKCIIMISNEKDFISYLDQRTRSRLVPELIEFNPYSYKETYDILNERRNIGFFENVLDDDCFEKIVEKTKEYEDIRTGLFLLKETGNSAENRSSRNCNIEDTNKAIGKLGAFMKSKVTLDDEQKEILKIIKENEGISNTTTYQIYKELFNKSERTFRRRLGKLKDNKLIENKEDKDENNNTIQTFFIKKS